jgi:hypothetical protein
LIYVLRLILRTGIPKISRKTPINRDSFRIAEGGAARRLTGAAGGANGARGTGGPRSAWPLTPTSSWR